MFIAGTGSYAAEILEYAEAAGLRVGGLIELIDTARVGTQIHGHDVRAISDVPNDDAVATVAIGANRAATWDSLAADGWRAATVLHPEAFISGSAQIGAGSIVGPRTVIGAETEIHEQVLIGRGALVGHHVTIGRGAVINPGANIGGNSSIGPGAAIGMGATVVNGTSIGERAVVAAGAVVVRDVGAGVRVQGIPARAFDQRSVDEKGEA